MLHTRLTYLFERWASATVTEAEQEDFFALAALPENRAYIEQLIEQQLYLPKQEIVLPDARTSLLLDTIFEAGIERAKEGSVPVHRVHFLKTAWFRYAAILLLVAGAATFLYLNNQPQKEITLEQPSIQQDIAPGGHRAILTLADGSSIVLDSAANGNLAIQGNTKILKLNAGALAYEASSASGEIGYNTISTPKGGQYQITLPDGSKVWLNAASSIRFPTVFNGKVRDVQITGEVYFEVAPGRAKPFIVKARDQDIHVIGTSFNINAYDNEASIKTSLLEGSVKINNVILKPGQAYANNKITRTDIDQDLAWKNGHFDFDEVGIQEAMRQLERWYDIKVEYRGEVPDIKLIGSMGRALSLSKVMRTLKAVNINLELKDRTLIVKP